MAVKILIPYNFTANDEKALEFAGKKYAGRNDVQITLFHAFPPIPDIDNLNSPIMNKVMLNTSFLRQQQDGQKNAMEAARQRLANYNINPDLIKCLYSPVRKDIADDIVQLCRAEAFDEVVLNRNPGSIINYFSRSISRKVIQYVSGRSSVHIVN